MSIAWFSFVTRWLLFSCSVILRTSLTLACAMSAAFELHHGVALARTHPDHMAVWLCKSRRGAALQVARTRGVRCGMNLQTIVESHLRKSSPASPARRALKHPVLWHGGTELPTLAGVAHASCRCQTQWRQPERWSCRNNHGSGLAIGGAPRRN